VSASSLENKKFAKQLIERGTKILQVPNPAGPLKSSDRERFVHKARFVLLRLLAPKAGNHRLKNLQSLEFAIPETDYPQIEIL
jgi:hypothetical protein